MPSTSMSTIRAAGVVAAAGRPSSVCCFWAAVGACRGLGSHPSSGPRRRRGGRCRRGSPRRAARSLPKLWVDALGPTSPTALGCANRLRWPVPSCRAPRRPRLAASYERAYGGTTRGRFSNRPFAILPAFGGGRPAPSGPSMSDYPRYAEQHLEPSLQLSLCVTGPSGRERRPLDAGGALGRAHERHADFVRLPRGRARRSVDRAHVGRRRRPPRAHPPPSGRAGGRRDLRGRHRHRGHLPRGLGSGEALRESGRDAPARAHRRRETRRLRPPRARPRHGCRRRRGRGRLSHDGAAHVPQDSRRRATRRHPRRLQTIGSRTSARPTLTGCGAWR